MAFAVASLFLASTDVVVSGSHHSNSPWWPLVTVLVAFIGSIPGILYGAAAWSAARKNRDRLKDHIADEGVTSEALLSALEKLLDHAGLTGEDMPPRPPPGTLPGPDGK